VIFMVVEVQEEPLTDLFAFCDVLAADFISIFVDWRAFVVRWRQIGVSPEKFTPYGVIGGPSLANFLKTLQKVTQRSKQAPCQLCAGCHRAPVSVLEPVCCTVRYCRLGDPVIRRFPSGFTIELES
jgi:hypothetical protein